MGHQQMQVESSLHRFNSVRSEASCFPGNEAQGHTADGGANVLRQRSLPTGAVSFLG